MNYFLGLSRVFGHPLNRGHFSRTFFRVAWWQFNRIYFKLPVIAEIIPGVKIVCKPDNSYGSLIVYTGLPEFSDQTFMYDYTKENDIVVDIGAHIGSESLILGSKLTQGKIISFEPTTSIYQELKTNILLNGYEKNIHCENQAVSDHSGYITFYESGTSETNSLGPKSDAMPVKTVCTTLDTYTKKNNIDHINLLKIDVEGFENLVFRGAQNILQTHAVDLIVFEYNARNGTRLEANLEGFEILRGAGYHLYEVNDQIKLTKYHPKSTVHNIVAVSPAINRKRLVKYV